MFTLNDGNDNDLGSAYPIDQRSLCKRFSGLKFERFVMMTEEAGPHLAH